MEIGAARLSNRAAFLLEAARAVGLLPRTLDDCDLLGREVVDVIDQIVDLTVERGAFVFVESLVSRRGHSITGYEITSEGNLESETRAAGLWAR